MYVKIWSLSKEITYLHNLELFNPFLITQAKTPKKVGHQSYVSEIKLPTRDTFLRLSWPVKSKLTFHKITTNLTKLGVRIDRSCHSLALYTHTAVRDSLTDGTG